MAYWVIQAKPGHCQANVQVWPLGNKSLISKLVSKQKQNIGPTSVVLFIWLPLVSAVLRALLATRTHAAGLIHSCTFPLLKGSTKSQQS